MSTPKTTLLVYIFRDLFIGNKKEKGIIQHSLSHRPTTNSVPKRKTQQPTTTMGNSRKRHHSMNNNDTKAHKIDEKVTITPNEQSTRQTKKQKTNDAKKKSKELDTSSLTKTIAVNNNNNDNNNHQKTSTTTLPIKDWKYIMAPMVGASELAFRLLCRKYGTQMCYTPMMMASQFATSSEYRAKEFQTTPFDRPLCCHFAANNPKDFAAAAKIAEPYCDAIDLNLGCPQVR